MPELRRYRNLVFDSARWTGFRFREGDIIICTPARCGTTWMQTLCAMLVFGSTTFDHPLTQISPWLDMHANELSSMLAALEAQEHRRLIKTHTPLDGLPLDGRANYVCVGRDPRDAAISLEHQVANMGLEVVMSAITAGVGVDELDTSGLPPELGSADSAERFRRWVYGEAEPTIPPLPTILHHLQTFWDRRAERHVALFHYADLLADLPGQIRRLADVLAIKVTDVRVEKFAGAATFESMKRRADDLVPDVDKGMFRDNREFFHRGYSGQWRDVLDATGLRRYHERVAEVVSPELAAWAHSGWIRPSLPDTVSR